MLSVHLKPKHLESLFITDMYEVQAGDVLGLKALTAESQIHQDLASCVGNGWICKPLLFSRQMLATSVCWLVAQTNQTNLQQPGRRLPGPRAVFVQLLQWLLQHPLLCPVPLPFWGVLQGLELLTGVVVSSCQVVSSLSVCILVSPTTPEVQVGS